MFGSRFSLTRLLLYYSSNRVGASGYQLWGCVYWPMMILSKSCVIYGPGWIIGLYLWKCVICLPVTDSQLFVLPFPGQWECQAGSKGWSCSLQHRQQHWAEKRLEHHPSWGAYENNTNRKIHYKTSWQFLNCCFLSFFQWKCCGVTGFTDWHEALKEKVVPDRCCQEHYQECGRNSTTMFWTRVSDSSTYSEAKVAFILKPSISLHVQWTILRFKWI